MDWAKVRADFPILDRTFHGKPFVYLDSAATSQKPNVVIDAIGDYYRQLNANVHRGTYQLSEEATEAYEGARARMAKFVHSDDPSEIVFVRGTTEAINLVAGSLSETLLRRGTRILTTVMEHHSNIVPWQMMRLRGGPDLDFVDIDDDGRLVRSDYDRLLKPNTKLVTLTHVSNVLGTVNPVREIADQAHAAGALVLVDAAQSSPHRKVDVRELGADFVAFSGDKMLGPTGIGVLWGRRDLLEKMPPVMGGGEMIREVHQDRVAFREPPARFEAGTPNISGAIGSSVAAEDPRTARVGGDRPARAWDAAPRGGAGRRKLRRPGHDRRAEGPQGTGSRRLVLVGRSARPRYLEHPRRRGGGNPQRAPLRPTPHGTAPRRGALAREPVHLQFNGRRRPPLRCAGKGRGSVPRSRTKGGPNTRCGRVARIPTTKLEKLTVQGRGRRVAAGATHHLNTIL